MKTGYKKTEVGVIPEEWSVEKLGSCLLESPSYGINAPAVPYSESLPVYIRITDITESGKFSPDNIASVDGNNIERYFLANGDIVFARTGASVGKSYLYDPRDGQLVFAGFLIRVKPDPRRLLPLYLAAYVTTSFYWSWVRTMSMRSGQPGINGYEYSQLPVALPPIFEQRAIAAALSDVDSLVRALEQLIAKKRDLKQVTMRQLLTGKKRKSVTIAEIASPARNAIVGGPFGSDLVSRDYVEQGVPVIRGQNMGMPWVSGEFVFVSHAKAASLDANLARPWDIIFTQRGTLGQVSLVPSAPFERYLVSQSQMKLSTSPTVADPLFVYYLFTSAEYQMLIKQSAIQTGVPHINLGILRNFRLPLPPLAEQKAIAAVLSDMDAEIDALTRRLDKTHALKQAMMQELLTGRTRLV